jgi:cell division protein FtsW
MAHASQLEHESVDPQWVTPICIITMLGLVMAFSASYPEACAGKANSPDASSFFKTQIMFAVVGLALGWITSFMRPKVLRVAAIPGLVVSFALMAVAIIEGMLGGATRGSYAWVHIGPVRFQPSEFARLFYVVYLASLLSGGALRGKFLRRAAQPLLLSLGLFGILLFGQRDLGMMILVVFVTFALCFLAGMKLKLLLPIIGGTLAIAIIYAMVDRGEHGGRWDAFIDPMKDPGGDGYQVLAMLVAIARGGILGQGLGECPDKWGQMPEAHTDAIFCVMAGELGFLRVALFILLLGFIVFRAMQIGRASGDPFSNLLCSGLAAMIGIQALVNMAVTMKLMPITGLTLPFISCGGSSLISCLIAAGMVLAVYRHRQPQQGGV